MRRLLAADLSSNGVAMNGAVKLRGSTASVSELLVMQRPESLVGLYQTVRVLATVRVVPWAGQDPLQRQKKALGSFEIALVACVMDSHQNLVGQSPPVRPCPQSLADGPRRRPFFEPTIHSRPPP